MAALVGLLSVAAGLGVGHLVGGLVSPAASPFLAVGNTAIDFTPSWLKDLLQNQPCDNRQMSSLHDRDLPRDRDHNDDQPP